VPLSRRSFLHIGGVTAGSAVVGWFIQRAKSRGATRLRPPGGDDEDALLAACIRCGQCVHACPVDALHLTDIRSGPAAATPYFTAREQPCDLCPSLDAMRCIAACPTTALQPVESRHEVRIGVAMIDSDLCFPWIGVACKACWHACPFPNDAIKFDERGRPLVVEQACVGCGLCEHVCLTEQPAIVVRPAKRET